MKIINKCKRELPLICGQFFQLQTEDDRYHGRLYIVSKIAGPSLNLNYYGLVSLDDGTMYSEYPNASIEDIFGGHRESFVRVEVESITIT